MEIYLLELDGRAYQNFLNLEDAQAAGYVLDVRENERDYADWRSFYTYHAMTGRWDLGLVHGRWLLRRSTGISVRLITLADEEDAT